MQKEEKHHVMVENKGMDVKGKVVQWLVGCIGCNSMKAYCLTGATPSHFLASASACDEAAALAPALQASGLPLASVVLVVEGSVRSHCANLQRGICS